MARKAERESSSSSGRAEAEKHTEVNFSPAVQRRILRFLNAARRAEDMVQRPNQGVEVMPERPGFKGPDVHEAMKKHGKEPGLDLESAKRLIDWRDKNTPFGFTNIPEIIELIRLDILRKWFFWFGPACYGQWDPLMSIPGGYDWPVHAAMLKSGKVLFFGLPTGVNTVLWDPNAAGAAAFTAPANQPKDSLFCSGLSFMSDGRLLVTGGGGDGTATGHHSHGWKFDPMSVTWSRTAGDGTPGSGDMKYTRWYPTLVTMGDEPGRVLVVDGIDGTVSQMEVYFETSDSFRPVWGPAGEGDTSANRSFPQLYPGMHLLPGAEIFYTPAGWASGYSSPVDLPGSRPSAYFSFASTSPPVTGRWTNVGPIAIPPAPPSLAEVSTSRAKGMAVLLLNCSYPYVQVMVVGGGSLGTSSTYQMINLSELDPAWGDPLPLPDGLSRVNVNLVLLPTGTVFLCGGRPQDPIYNGGTCWIFDPASYNWYEMEELSNQRQYHSVAVLLPSGKVAVAGNQATTDRTIEVFSPPYLFNWDGSNATRPSITDAPDSVDHGATFTIETPDPASIARVVFVRPTAVTHQTNSEQRVVPLTFCQAGPTSIAATAPNGAAPHAIAPRGWYMLFILNRANVPSVAKFIFLH